MLLRPILTAAMLAAAIVSAPIQNPPKGSLLYHSYSSYDAMDSTLKLLHAGELREIKSEEFIHAMNGDFGSHAFDIVFMAIDPVADEWDIFRYQAITGEITNLTLHSGFRNEDPKFSPDGLHIIFKRGHWEGDGFVYDLAEMDLRTGTITMLTDDAKEESMPCYSADGSLIYYAEYDNGKTAICAYDRADGSVERLYQEEGIQAYYPMASEEGLYFTKWYSAFSQNDTIVHMENGEPVMLPFCDDRADYSDVFPMNDGNLYCSSTLNGSYDLYYYDGTELKALDALNTDQHDLGVSCYTAADAEKIIRNAQNFLLTRGSEPMNMDANGDGVVDGFDLAMLKRMGLEMAE